MNFRRALTLAEMSEMKNALTSMMENIPVVRSFECGFDLGLAASEGQAFSLTARFDSVESYKSYSNHPSHLNFVDTYVKPNLAENGRRAIQYIS